jgi:transglutaminase superfamily protein
MHIRSRTLVLLATCGAMLIGCLGGKPTATPFSDAPAATRAGAVEATATLAIAEPTNTPDESAPVAAPTWTPEPGAAKTPSAGTVEYAGGRLGVNDGYVFSAPVSEQAAALGYDPARIFAFVRDTVAFESYRGVLRGAQGTLWGGAGNAADQAVLLYALLRESGVQARFARGSLSKADAQTLLQTMFSPALDFGLSGVEPSGEVADPLDDPNLLAETTDHLWVQAFSSNGWLDLDPAFPDAQMGDRHAEPQATLNRLPDALYHRLHIRVRLERITAQGLEISYPLAHEARVADLVGQKIVFRHVLEQMGSQGGMEAAEIGRIIGARQRRYHPLLQVGSHALLGDLFTEAEGLDLDAPVGRMAHALGDQNEEAGPLSGEWIELTLTYPDGREETVERAVFDRLGPSARTANDLERLIRTDMSHLLLGTYLSLYVAPCRVPFDAAQEQIEAVLQPLLIEHENLRQHLDALLDEGIETKIKRFLSDSFLPYDTRLWTELAHVANVMMASAGDGMLDGAAELLAVKAYYDSPRLLVADLHSLNSGATAFSLDLRRDAVRAEAYPGVDKAGERAFRTVRGMLEASLEGAVLQAITQQPSITAPVVFRQALDQGIEMQFLVPDDRDRVDEADWPKDARARIVQDLRAGYGVIVPERFVVVPRAGGEPRVAWWRVDLTSGEMVGVMDTGLHQSMTFYENVIMNVYLGQLTGKLDVSTDAVDVLIGYDTTLINFAGNVLGALDAEKPWNQIRTEAAAELMNQARQTALELTAAGAHTSVSTFLIGAGFAVNLLDNSLGLQGD